MSLPIAECPCPRCRSWEPARLGRGLTDAGFWARLLCKPPLTKIKNQTLIKINVSGKYPISCTIFFDPRAHGASAQMKRGIIVRSATFATGFGIVAMLMALASPQASLAQPGAEFQAQGKREANGYPRFGEPFRARRAYVAPPAYGVVPERAPVHHPKVTSHR
jgi:hypothetical protein